MIDSYRGILVRDEGVVGSNPITPTISEHSGTDTAQIRALIEARRGLTNRRNIEPDIAERERQTAILNNLDGLIRDPGDAALRAQFMRNLTTYGARRAGRA